MSGVPPLLPMVERDDTDGPTRELFDEIARTRKGMPTSFRVFLNSPGAARAIADFGTFVRFEAPLPPKVLEIAVMRVAALHDDDYMWVHHLQLARESGLTDHDLERLHALGGPSLQDTDDGEIVAFVDAQVQGPMLDDLFVSVADRLGAARTVELALAVAYYQLIHSLFTALRLEGAQDTRVPLPTDAGSPTDVPNPKEFA